MSNREYDALYDELAALEQETGIILSGSPTQHVGYEVLSELEKMPHESPMLSLDKTKSPEASGTGWEIERECFPGRWTVSPWCLPTGTARSTGR